jgi:hypothetical protein
VHDHRLCPTVEHVPVQSAKLHVRAQNARARRAREGTQQVCLRHRELGADLDLDVLERRNVEPVQHLVAVSVHEDDLVVETRNAERAQHGQGGHVEDRVQHPVFDRQAEAVDA